MRYWAYVNNEVAGPFEVEKLCGLPNFSLTSHICPETLAGGRGISWKEASSYPDVKEGLSRPPAPVQPRRPVAVDPPALTMRGSLIEEPVNIGPAGEPKAPAVNPGNAALPSPASPHAPAKTLTPSVLLPSKEMPRAALPGGTPAMSGNAVRSQPDPQLEELKQKIDHLGAMLVTVAENQSRLVDRLNRLEIAVEKK